MTTTLSINAGATLDIPLLVALPTGTWTCSSQLRSSTDVLIATLSTSLTAMGTPDAAGNTHSGLLSATSVQTAAWAPGNWLCDVKFTDASTTPVVVYSDPFVVQVVQAKTHG
jgi:hypothetical protein